MDLTNLSDGIQKRKLKKRVGRGIGSGHGKTASRGHKGQYASAGSGKPGLLFVGGQSPLHRRIPKRGFSNARFAKQCAIVNIGDLNAFDNGATVDIAALRERRIVTGTWDGLRVLGEGELTKKLTVTADHFTAKAKAQIEGKGGTTTLIPAPKTPVRNKMGQGKRDMATKAKVKAKQKPDAK
jgi:large subunit ribosomal protein L15